MLGIVGMAFAVARRETRLLPLAWLTVVAFLMYALLPDERAVERAAAELLVLLVLRLGGLRRDLVGAPASWCCCGTSCGVRTRFSERPYAPFVAIVVVAIVAVTSVVAGGWIRWNYTGYEKKAGLD